MKKGFCPSEVNVILGFGTPLDISSNYMFDVACGQDVVNGLDMACGLWTRCGLQKHDICKLAVVNDTIN